ncbi:MAG: hypothetical protein BRC55_16110 [Cyanobacteria bacterium SW_8_48_13]|nr:MAG: hypothetical protein BRC55_16110 [Cyanobacteria bacterium SW_8_48_13]
MSVPGGPRRIYLPSRESGCRSPVAPVQHGQRGQQAEFRERRGQEQAVAAEVVGGDQKRVPVRMVVRLEMRPEAAVVQGGVPGQEAEEEREGDRDAAEVQSATGQTLRAGDDAEDEGERAEGEKQRPGVAEVALAGVHHERHAALGGVQQVDAGDHGRKHCGGEPEAGDVGVVHTRG